MRVLFFNLSNVGRKGGDTTWCRNTMAAMRELGVDCTFSDADNIPLSFYDVVHIIHCQAPQSVRMWQRCRQEGKPYVVSAIYYPQSATAHLPDMVNGSVCTIVCSEAERGELTGVPGVNADRIIIIPSGVDKSLFHPGPHLGSGVLSVGPLTPAKGHLHVAEACNRLSLPLTIITPIQPRPGDPYADAVRRLAGSVLSMIPLADVAGTYRQNNVYVCGSHSDRQSLAVLEAAASGLNIVDSIYNRGSDLLPSSIVVDPNDPAALDNAIQRQWERVEPNSDKIASWLDVSRLLLPYYRRVTE